MSYSSSNEKYFGSGLCPVNDWSYWFPRQVMRVSSQMIPSITCNHVVYLFFTEDDQIMREDLNDSEMRGRKRRWVDGGMEEVWFTRSAVFTLEAYCCCWQLHTHILSFPDSLLSPHIASYVEKPSDSSSPARPRSQSPTLLIRPLEVVPRPNKLLNCFMTSNKKAVSK